MSKEKRYPNVTGVLSEGEVPEGHQFINAIERRGEHLIELVINVDREDELFVVYNWSTGVWEQMADVDPEDKVILMRRLLATIPVEGPSSVKMTGYLAITGQAALDMLTRVYGGMSDFGPRDDWGKYQVEGSELLTWSDSDVVGALTTTTGSCCGCPTGSEWYVVETILLRLADGRVVMTENEAERVMT